MSTAESLKYFRHLFEGDRFCADISPKPELLQCILQLLAVKMRLQIIDERFQLLREA